MTRTTTLALLCLAAASCVQTVTVSQASPELPEALVSVPTRAWEVHERRGGQRPVDAGDPTLETEPGGETLVGLVLRFEPSDGFHDAFHSVRNVWNQELGLVDADGRSWRYHPHGDGPLWLGTGPVSEGVFAILGLDPERARLVEASLESLGQR